jgi:peptide/nickel transport system substrate-binding protein
MARMIDWPLLRRPTRVPVPTRGPRRRGRLSKALALVAVSIGAAVLVLGSPGWAQTPKRGGVLRVAVLGDPPTLDSHWTTANFVEIITQHIYEGLYTLDQNYQPIPDLADGLPVASADGLTYTIKLRPGIKFHNGKEMTSEDVVASLKRWGGYAAQAKALWASVEEVRPAGKHAVEIRLKERSGVVLISLANANNFGAIYPKEIAEKYPTPNKVAEFIGTGPYRFVEWKPDSHIRMVRYDDYKPRSEAPNGWGGRKTAYLDEIRWIPTPDVATRVAALESAEVDFADDLQPDAYDRVKANPKLKPIVVRPFSWAIGVFNKKEGLMTNVKLRLAIQAAIDVEPVMKGAVGNPLFYRLDPGLSFQEQKAWHSTVGAQSYNQHNKEKAKQLLREAGYNGEPIRFLTTKEYAWMYNYALVTKQQLEELGVNVDLQVVDWATLVQRRNNPQMYDIFTTGMSFVPDPTQHPYLRCDWPGWTCDEEIQRRMDAIRKESDPAKRKAQWDEVQKRFYEYVPAIRYGDIFGFRAMQAYVKGFNENMTFPRFYNVWLDK